MKSIIITILCFALISPTCLSGDKSDNSEIPKDWKGQIGKEFTDWIPKSYKLDEDKTDVVSGLGGRWITYYYTSNNEVIEQKALIDICKLFYKKYGWKESILPLRKNFVLSKRYDSPLPELRFTRTAFPYQESSFSSQSYIFISNDGKTIIQYCEVGW